jgi:UDP-GlcNAc:undecaprenyl-phosphate GlcNAc-1-phosphate transferase
MTDWITLHPLPVAGLLVAVMAAAATALLVPVAALIARLVGAVDDPLRDDRRVHRVATPTMGGLAIVGGVVAVAVLWLPSSDTTTAILVAAGLCCFLGAVDDALDLPPGMKLLGQVAIAVVPVAAGVRIDHLTLPLVGALDLHSFSYAVTVLWIVAVMNVVNFIDGMDGLAAGVCGIAAATFAIIALSLLRGEAGVLAAATAGACLGFLVWNFHPARVFMGDAGSLPLGLLLATTAVQGALKSAAAVSLVLPLLVLAVPLLDTGFVILKRLKYRRPIYAADRNHFHHRFANIGYTQRRAALFIYGWCAMLAGAGLAVAFVPFADGPGYDWWPWGALLGAIMVAAVAVSLFMIYELEILKLGGLKARRQRRSRPRVRPEEGVLARSPAQRAGDTGRGPAVRRGDTGRGPVVLNRR